jgi:putative drug exporter of the RND superfamily
MTGPLYRLGGVCSRHHWPVIGIWVVVVIALALGGRAAGEQFSDNLTLPGTGSTQAQDLLQDRLPDQANGTNPIVLEAGKGKLSNSKNSKAVDDAVKALKKNTHVIRAVSPLGKAKASQLSKDGTIGFISVTLDEGPSELTEEEAQDIIDVADGAVKPADIRVEAGGYLGKAVSKADTESSEAVGLGAAVIILLFAFGTVTAMILPIITAVIGLVATLSVIGLIGHVVEIPTVAPTLATMIGLGVGIDYALFIVTRHKLQMRDGMDIPESIARSTATAGGAVVFAGGTVVIALVSLLASGIPLMARWAAPRPWQWSWPSSPRSRCCRPCSVRWGRASTRCASSSGRRIRTITARTDGPAGPAACRAGRGGRSSPGSLCSPCSPIRCSIWSSAPRTTATWRRTPRPGRPMT